MGDLISAAWETFGRHCHCGQSFCTDEQLKRHEERKHPDMTAVKALEVMCDVQAEEGQDDE